MRRWLVTLLILMVSFVPPEGERRVPVEVRIARLRQEISRLNQHYFHEHRSLLPDEAFDRLVSELALLEEKNPGLLAMDSPTQTIEPLPVSSHSLTLHTRPALSLNKAYQPAEVLNFYRRISRNRGEHRPVKVSITPKLDGVSLFVLYEQGRLVRALTRGDGVRGEDVTANARSIATLPLQLTGEMLPDRLEVRGEVYLTYSDLEALNTERLREGKTSLANPRNAAAGFLSRRDPEEAACQPLRMAVFDVIQISRPLPLEEEEAHACLREWGLPVVPFAVSVTGEEELLEVLERLEVDLPLTGLPTDGVVIKASSLALRRSLGEGRRAPTWALAFKWSSRSAVSHLRRVLWQVGRSGQLTPVASFDPVRLAGVEISRATLHSAEALERMAPRFGDALVIERTGGVIPGISGILRVLRTGAEREVPLPSSCPGCQSTLDRQRDQLFCRNRECEEFAVARLIHFAGSSGMGISGLGPKNCRRLVVTEGLRRPDELYTLTPAVWEKLKKSGGPGAKEQDLIRTGIEESRHNSLARLLTALSIPDLGPQAAREIEAHYLDLTHLLAQKDFPGRRGSRTVTLEKATEQLRLPEVRRELELFEGMGITGGRRVEGKRR